RPVADRVLTQQRGLVPADSQGPGGPRRRPLLQVGAGVVAQRGGAGGGGVGERVLQQWVTAGPLIGACLSVHERGGVHALTGDGAGVDPVAGVGGDVQAAYGAAGGGVEDPVVPGLRQERLGGGAGAHDPLDAVAVRGEAGGESELRTAFDLGEVVE